MIFYMSVFSIRTSFLSLILLIHIFSIFCCYCCWCCCWWLWLMVYQFCFSSQRTNFSCIDLCYCLLPFYFIYFFSDLYYFFVCTNFGVFCSFSRCFRCKAWIAIWYLSCFVGRGCLLWPVHFLGKTLLVFALLHSVFQSVFTILHPHLQRMRILGPHPHQYLVLSAFWILAMVTGKLEEGVCYDQCILLAKLY